MRHRRSVLVAMVALGTGCKIENRPPRLPADLVIRGVAIYTMAPAKPWAEAIAVRDGRIMFVGDDSAASRLIGSQTVVHDLGGRMVLPGFNDSHSHPLSAGLELGECNLYNAETSTEIEGLIRACASAPNAAGWIRGNGWQLPVFPNANPTRQLLDRLVPDRPAFFYAADGHSAWVNSKALEMAGVTRETKDPADGRIERDAKGEPSGTLREGAVGLVAKYLPPYTPEMRIGAARRGLSEANRFGITSITDADANAGYLDAYMALESRGELTARVNATLHSEDGTAQEEVARLVAERKKYHGGRLSVGAVKFFADGVIEAGTAALLQPYADRHGAAGELNYTPEDFAERIAVLDRAGFQIHIHAIGDRAIRVSLDALAGARRRNGPRDARPILAHIQLIDPADISRFRSEGVIASFQPYWAQADEYITALTEPQLGPARSRWLYPIASVMNSGAVVVGGSDWSVSSLNPLDAIQVAITRHAVESTGAPWIPQETVDLPRMLAAYTINAAYASRSERDVGSLEVGKLADMIVLDRNLFAIPVTEIHQAKVLLTLVEGKTVFEDSAFSR
ncbi:MAG TPA: amidohydrolase [Gemmatimonadales bacterium]|nr:amidohydrolase [Gemmatimonadales bacterium]